MSTTVGSHSREARGLHVASRNRQARGRYGFLFPQLSPRPDVEPFPDRLGVSPGPMVEQVPLINDRIVSGLTYLGQFIDHDLTFDPTPILKAEQDPDSLTNFRTPAFDLDSLYGLGPWVQPHLYDRARPGYLLLARREHDLPRNAQGTALIGDPRNDDHLILAQLHVAFSKFHNAVHAFVQEAALDPQNDAIPFARAQRLVRWHYQWIVLHEFLPTVVGQEVVDDILTKNRQFYHWEEHGAPYIPLEFNVAAYRFGHSLVQSHYQLNAAPRMWPIFSWTEPDLRGGRPIPPTQAINWKNFFDTGVPPDGDEPNRQASPINVQLAMPLHHLPESMIPSPAVVPPDFYKQRSLAIRNLQRSQALKLPSGQDVADHMGFSPLDEAVLWADQPASIGQPAPLWYYILKEADVQQEGRRLGEVGGRIVAEVLIGLLQGDPESFLSKAPNWTPTLPRQHAPTFTMVDLLRFAGVKTQ